MTDENSKLFIGATLLEVQNSNETVWLITDRGTLALNAEGDCCSNSWFESVENDACGGTITEIDLSGTYSDITPEGHYGAIQAYFPLVKTTKGRVCMEMRNESNGYYGGYIRTSVS